VKEKYKCIFLLCIISLSCFFCGCSNKVLKHGSFEDPALLPDTKRIGAALRDAAIDPYIGITTAALIVTAASGKDKQISSYAARHTPVFGSNENARTATNITVAASAGIAALTYTVKYLQLHQPSGQNSCPVQTEFGIPSGLYAPLVSAEVAVVSGALTLGTTTLIKNAAKRERPDLSDALSFPSMHTSVTAVANTYSARTINSMSLSPSYSYPAYAALTALTLCTAWGRVEGGKHYPTDVMAGALIGTFFANAAYNAFLGPYLYIENFNLQITPNGAAAAAALNF
jgi:hypothetical protein